MEAVPQARLTVVDHGSFYIRPMEEADIPAAGRIMCESFNTQNQGLGLPPEWPDEVFTSNLIGLLFGNPGFIKIVAVDRATDALIGVNFLESGDPVTAPGPISVDTQAQNKGVGRALMEYVLEFSLQLQKPDIRLVQVANNLKSFALYASQDFKFGETLTMIAGRVAENQLEDAGYTIRPMTEADVAACSAMHERANMFPRSADIMGAVFEGSPHQPFVALQNDQIVAYTTGFFLLGHSVAETPAAFKALFGWVSQRVDNALFHLPARVYPELLKWALTEAQLRVVRQEILMYRGAYAAPHHDPIYLPGMAY